MVGTSLSQSHSPFLLVLAAVMAIASGCGDDKGRVTGTVTIDGAPIKGGRVVFHKEGQAPAIANINNNGTFELAIGDSKGIQPGSYKVTVASYDIGTPANPGDPPPATLTTPREYVDVTTTPLISEITKGENEVELELVTN